MSPDSAPPGTLQDLDDYALVRAMAERRVEAMGELWDRYAPTLLGLARGVLGAGPAAEEALHEGLLHAWTHADRYDPARSSVSTWLVLTVRSRALARRRAAGAGGEREAEPATRPFARVAEPPELADRRGRVREALVALPAPEREVVELAFWEGLSPAEIARRTDADVLAVRERALGAMKALRQRLRDDLRELM